MKKNSLVQTTAPYEGRLRSGVVLQSAKGKLKVLLDDGISVVSAPTSRFLPFDGPLPAALKSKHKEGDTVSFLDKNGVEQLGVVASVSVGSVKVFCNKGRSVVESVPSTFTKTEHAIIPALIHHSVAAFRLRTFKAQAGHGDSPAFTAVIEKNGVDSIRVVSDGWGGPCECQPMNLRDPSAPQKFEEAVQEWCKAAGAPDNFFGVESWIDWSRNFQPYALEAAEYFAGEIRTK